MNFIDDILEQRLVRCGVCGWTGEKARFLSHLELDVRSEADLRAKQEADLKSKQESELERRPVHVDCAASSQPQPTGGKTTAEPRNAPPERKVAVASNDARSKPAAKAKGDARGTTAEVPKPKSDRRSKEAQRRAQEEAEEEIEVEYSGAAVEVGFNVSYLLDVLGVMRSDTVRLDLIDAQSSCLMQAPEDGTSRYVVMPMRL